MPYDASSRKDVRAAQKQARLAEQQRREIVNGIMSVEPGRRWMCDILEVCHIFATSYSDVGLRMSFMEGQREVGLRLLMDIMQSCPDQYIQMMRERNERNAADDARARKGSRRDDSRSDEASGVEDADDGTEARDEYHGD